MATKNISLEKALQSYRTISTDTKHALSVRRMSSFDDFDIAKCSKEQKEEYFNILSSIPITITPRISSMKGRIESLKYIYDVNHNETNKKPSYADDTSKDFDAVAYKRWKESHECICATSDGMRLSGKDAWLNWNGFQVIDLDIKNEWEAKALRYAIFEGLKKCNWFLGVTFSTSGKGLHVYTKILIPEEFKGDIDKLKLLYYVNYRHKHSFVYITALKHIQNRDNITKDDLMTWMDLAMFRPQQPAFIGYDEDSYWNANFFEDYIYVCFDNVEDLGCPEVDWIAHPDLRETFKRYEFLSSEEEHPDLERLSEAKDELPTEKSDRIHYKHAERWKLANTLVNLYGLDEGFRQLRKICSLDISDRELYMDCATAARHKKASDPWAVARLNKTHKYKIKMKVEDKDIEEAELLHTVEFISNPNYIAPTEPYTININKRQYLGDVMDEIVSKCSRITLLEAGPGLGKTEMVKKLVSTGKKIMMVMPFTSTIKSKVEEQEGWAYSYGARKPKLDVKHGLALTMDKFSRLSIMDIKASGFDYIFIDESHLMFMSSYRPIMSTVIDMICQSEVPVILMSGTPTGELVFFPNIMHIHVIKEETRKKTLSVYLVDNTSNLMYFMCREMARSVVNGRRVLFPSNEGSLFSKKIKAGVEWFLQHEHQDFRDLNIKYYKKSQVGEEFMDDVNFRRTIKNIEILMCSSYLSVGVDILEKDLDFDIYFGDLCTAAEADQWANRLRSKDLHIRMFVAKNDADGNPRFIDKYKPLNLKLDEEEIKDMHSILRICNASLERNPNITKYNPLIANILQSSHYIEYDKVLQKYHLNDLSYKLTKFEDKVRDYQQQLPVFMKGMESYGYEISAKDLGAFSIKDDQGGEMFNDIKNMVQRAVENEKLMDADILTEFLDILPKNYDKYVEVLEARMDLKKGYDWKIDENNDVITVKSIEVVERALPIYVSLHKLFEHMEIKEIFEFCRRENGTYNMAALGRVRSLINLLTADQNERLDVPIKKYMEDVYLFVEEHEGMAHKDEINDFIAQKASDYAKMESTNEIIIERAELSVNRLKDILERIFKCLVNVSRPSKKMCTMDKIEILWQTREDKFVNNGLTFTLSGFLDDAIEVTRSNIEMK